MKILASALLACLALTASPPAGAGASTGASAEAKNPKGLKGWEHYEGDTFIAWIPNRKWQVVDSAQCCIDISSPTGNATASFGYSPTPALLPIDEALRTALSETADVRIVDQGQAFAHQDGTRQVTEYTGVKNGRAVRGVATVDVFQNAGGYGFSGYFKAADTNVWNKSKRKLQLILENIKYLGRDANPPPY